MMFSTNMAVLVDALTKKRGESYRSIYSVDISGTCGRTSGGRIYQSSFRLELIFAVSAAVSAPAFFAAVKNCLPEKPVPES